MTMTYNIAHEFSMTPGGRFRKHGPYSGEEFREDVLCDLLHTAIEGGDKLAIVLDGAVGYPSSFLEEAFGGLVRLRKFSHETIRRHLEVQALNPLYETYRISANRYMDNAHPPR